MSHSVAIRLATTADLPAINDLYNHYVDHSTCTYQTVPTTPEERAVWFSSRSVRQPVYVMTDSAGDVIAWHSLTPFKVREGYYHTIENSIYVRQDRLGKGLGRRMLEHQLGVAAALDYHAVLAVICSTQEPSLKLHREFGFEEAGRLRRVGWKFGRWLDIVIMEKLLPLAAGR